MNDEPAGQTPPESDSGMSPTSGNEPSDFRGQPASKSDSKQTPASRGDLNKKEADGGGTASGPSNVPEDEQSFYKKAADGGGQKRGRLRTTFFGTRRRTTIFGTGVIGTIAGLIIMFSVASGPLQFIHLSQRLQEIHFAGLQDQQDNRFLHEVRFIRFASRGEIERTRLGILGNKFADTFEAKLNASGLKSAYSDKFGLFDGYVIDRSEGSPFHGYSEKEIKSVFKAEGIDVVKGSELRLNGSIKNELVVPAKGLGLYKTRALTRTMLDAGGYSKLSQAISARIMCARAGCTLHPLKILGAKTKSALEDWWGKRAQADEQGEESLKGKTTKEKGVTKKNKTGVDEVKGSIAHTNSVVDEAGGDPAKVSASLSGSLIKGGGTAVGVLCIVRGLNGSYVTLKQSQVVLPLVRLGTEMVALGSEIQTGQDVNLDELSQYSQNLYGKDSTGGNSGVFDAASFKAADGQTGGVPADPTLTSIGKGSPFSFIEKVPGLGGACSWAGSIALGVVSIALDATGIGGVVWNAANGVVQGVLISQFSSSLAHWLVGKAVDVNNVIGGDYGNYINYGAHLAANMEGILAGGLALLPGQAAQLQNYENYAANQDFASHSLAYKLFNPYDDHSAISRVINNSSPSPSSNFAEMGSSLLNVGHIFGSFGSLLFGHAKAASTNYDYGFPTYGFSVQDMDNAPDDPYQNACDLFSCAADAPYHGAINGSLADINGNQTDEGSSLIKKAEACFQVNISNDSGAWDVTGNSTSNDNSFPSYEQINTDGHGCSSNDPNWLKLRFFIMDTETMNAMACYQGSDSDSAVSQACSDVGFSSSTSTSTGGSTPTGGGPTTGPASLSINNAAAMQTAKSSGAKVGYALFDSSGNNLAEYNDNSENYGASITKAMILVAYLNQVGPGGLSNSATSNLTGMIEQSVDSDANNVLGLLKNPQQQIESVAKQAGMTGFKFNITGDRLYWLGQSQITAADFAKFFAKIDTMFPAAHKGFALNLLSNISPNAGLLQAGLPGTVYSKEGWKPEPGGGSDPARSGSPNPFGLEGAPFIVNQAAQFSYGGKVYGIAVTVGGAANISSAETIIKNVVQALVRTN